MRTAVDEGSVLSWEHDVSLLTEPMIVGPIARVIAIVVSGLGALMSGIFALQGEAEVIGTIWLAMAATGLGLFVFLLLVIVVVFGNRMRCSYRVDARGVHYELRDRRAGVARTLAIVVGLVSRSPGVVGAGLVAESQVAHDLSWRGAFRVEFVAHRHLIVFRNAWRRLLLVHCSGDNYDAVATRIAAEIARHGTATRVPEHSPLPRYLGLSAFVVCATIPLFVASDEFGTSLLLPILMVCFSLATVWLIGLFGYVVIAIAGAMVIALLRHGLAVQVSWLRPGERYAQYAVYSPQEWVLLSAAVLGMLLLAWFGWRAARGRFVPMLQADEREAGA